MEHDKYWAERFEQLTEAELRKADDLSAEMVKEYRQTAQDLNDDIQRWYARFAAENKMSLAEARRVLTGRELAEFRWTVDEYIKYAKKADLSEAYIQKLKNASARVHIDRLEAIRMQMAQHVEKLAAKGNARLTDVLRDIYPDAQMRTAYEVQKKKGFEPFARIPEADVDRILKKPWVSDGLNFSDRIWRDKERLLNTLQGELTRGLIRGEPYGKIAQRIAGRMGVARSAAARLVETEAAFFSSRGQLDAFRDLGVEQYEFVATLDSRTSETCREMDGKVLPLSEFKPGITAPPLHCHCRSTTCPYFDDEFTEGETRAAHDPETGKTVQVDSRLTYENWKNIFVDKTQTLDEWEENVASQATNAPGTLNAAAQNGTINVEQELRANATKLQATMSGTDYDEYIDLLKDNDKIAPLYKHYADSITTVRRANKDGYYEHQTSTLEWSYPEARDIAAGMHKYHTLSHEYGHLFDWSLPTSKLTFKELDAVNAGVLKISDYRVSFCDEFLAAMRADKVHLRKIVTSAVKAEFRANAASAGVQDAIDGLFVNSRIYWGHGEKYYNFYYNHIKKWRRESDLKLVYKSLGMDASNQAKVKAQCRIYLAASEAWANITSAVTCGGEDLEYVKQYLPHSYQAFMEILEKVTP
ncbi:minor capsid protein [Selenomonas flueggei]|uniref:minor capsid protein n=1 Tax=Selenomonas flueggei TaxID=135080 RepID=UPI002672A825|nr:minor capsid protein [Selenomonas flueggei]